MSEITKSESHLHRTRFLLPEFILYYLVRHKVAQQMLLLETCDQPFLLLTQVLVAAAWKFIARGVQLSKEVGLIVNAGGHHRFNLQPGWLLGATQVCL